MKNTSVYLFGYVVAFSILAQIVFHFSNCSATNFNSTIPEYSGHQYLKDSFTSLNGKKYVTVGFLGSYGHNQVGLGALPLAVDAVNKDPKLLPGLELKYVAADIGTNPPLTDTKSFATCAIEKMTEMRDSGSIAFIGPDDTCSSEALVAAAWNLPMISYKCADTKVSDKKIFSTFARTLPPSSKVSKSVISLLRAFDWLQFTMIVCQSRAWVEEVKDAIKISKAQRYFSINVDLFLGLTKPDTLLECPRFLLFSSLPKRLMKHPVVSHPIQTHKPCCFFFPN